MNTLFRLTCAFFLLFLINQLVFITDVRGVMYDEAWYASTGYNIAMGAGINNTIVGSGGDVNFIFPLFCALFLKIFGNSLFSIRLTAFFFGIITFFAICSYLKKCKFKTWTVLLTLFLFTSLTLFNTIFRFGRPECASIAFISIGIISFYGYLTNHSYISIVFLSISTILSGLAHPFALMPFCLMGIVLVWDSFKQHSFRKELPKLAFLLIAGISVIVTLYLHADNSAGISERYSISNIKNSIPFYYKELFLSRHVIETVTFVSITIYELLFCKNKLVKYLSIIGFATLILFPMLFTTDLMMVGLGLDYVAIIAVFIFPNFIEDICAHLKRESIIHLAVTGFCIFNLALSYYYNFSVKYEKTNSVLEEELNNIIPESSNVFGPLRLWPFAMKTYYISDHYRKNLLEYDELDYIITSSQDLSTYTSYQKYLSFLYEENVVYIKETQQYGTIKVYKCK